MLLSFKFKDRAHTETQHTPQKKIRTAGKQDVDKNIDVNRNKKIQQKTHEKHEAII